ncbi:hypothetical protein BASA81_014314 [Batrachochytrium salamandrivorans]|nr:hypothetical protein BASA81_014314 [Batrachochytrium salamandrivorans]
MDDVPEVILERCKRELKHFRFRDNSFLRILEDGKSTAAYVTTDKRVDVMKHYHTSLAHLKYGSIIDLLLRRFWWPSMKKDLKDFIARCPECQLDRSSSGIHAPLPIRPVPPVALPFERWGIDFYGPMAETKSGNKYLITCIDYATRWVLAKPVKDMTESADACYAWSWTTTLVHGKRDRWDEYLPQVTISTSDSNTRCHWILPVSSSCSVFILVSQLTRHLLETLWRLLTKSNGWRRTPNFIARNLEEVGQARSAANVRTKAQSEAMRKRGGFDENTPDYFFKVGDMVKMKHHERLKA